MNKLQAVKRSVHSLMQVGSRSGKSFGGTRSETGSYYVSGDSSNQIVAYGKGTSSAQIGDLSAALAFAFGNGGKFGRMDGSGNIQMLNFLQHIGRRSMDKGMIVTRSSFGKISTNGHCPTFSHIHINEVSKGVQKLNQILRACSNGVNFDRYSIEVGRELLKGAMDLEESLRVLADLQEASDYMNSTQRKSKIKLLEDDEEDDENESAKLTEMKRLDRPRFSFDKPSRTTTSTKETAKNGIKQQFMALTYGEETPRLQAKQLQSSSNFGSHTRSGSYLPDYGTLSTYFEPKSPSISSHSKPEKGRISNVIAKLMGLDELPSKGDSKTTEKEMSSKRKESTVSKKHGASDDSIPQQTENGPHSSSQKRMASSQITPSRDTAFVQKAERIQAIPNGSSKVALSEENSLQQDIEIAARKDAGSVSKIATIIMDNQQSRVNQHNEVAGYRKVLHEKRKEENNKIDEENIVTKKGESKDLFMNNEKMPKAPERQKVSEENALEDTFIKRHAAQTEKKNAGNLLQSKQQKQQHGHEHQQLKVTKKFDNLQEKRKQDVVKQKLQAREAKGNQNELTVLPKTKDSAKGSTKKQLYANLAPGSKKKPMKHIEVKPKGPPNSRNVARATHETSMHVPHQRKKINNKKINESQIDKKIDTVANRRNGTLDHSAGPLNSHSPVRPEMKHQKDEKASINRVAKQESEPEHKGTEAGITEFKETEGSSYPANGVAQLKNVAEGVTFNNSDENECQGLEVPKSLTSSDSVSPIPLELRKYN